MNDSNGNRWWRWIANHRWSITGAILYSMCLGYVLFGVGFGEERATRQYIAEVSAHASHEPISALPVMRTLQWPDIAMQRDPFHPATWESKQVRQKP